MRYVQHQHPLLAGGELAPWWVGVELGVALPPGARRTSWCFSQNTPPKPLPGTSSSVGGEVTACHDLDGVAGPGDEREVLDEAAPVGDAGRRERVVPAGEGEPLVVEGGCG